MTVVMVKSSFLFLNEVGGTELLLIGLVVLLLFGGKKIPELMRGLGKGMREFNDAKNNVRREIEEGMRDINNATTAAPAATPAAPAAPAAPVAAATDIDLEKKD
ncbi:MAG TPA: twin-arginine translocase TatA/TatE family subunit [Chitinophaga sp.]